MLSYIPYLVFLLLFLFGGLWVGAALGLTGFLAIWSSSDLMKGLRIFGTQAWTINSNFVLISLPLFIFMGEMMARSGFINKIYSKLSIVLSGLPGNLLHSNIFSCAVFAACSGSSIASAAAIGSIGYPAQKELKYDRALSLGSITAGGTLGILIPPSIPLIIYAALAEESLGKLYLGGVIPGVLLSLLFIIQILAVCIISPSKAPVAGEKVAFRQRLKALGNLWEAIVLIVVILGGIYAGVATPTEVAALGAVMTFIFGAVWHDLTMKRMKEAMVSAVSATSMIMFIVIGAQMLSTSLMFFNIPPQLSRAVSEAELSPGMVLFWVTMLYVIMGCFFDGVSMMVITIPFISPILKVVGIDLVWFGIYLVVLIEIGLLTPPIGLNLYVIKGVTTEPMGLIIRGSTPFLIPMLMMLVVLILFPNLVSWFPGLIAR